MKARFCLLIFLLSLTLLTFGQGEKKPRAPEDYRPRTLRELSTLVPDIIAESPEYKANADKELAIMVHADPLPSRVKVTYHATTRPLNEQKKIVIKNWANRFAGAPEFYMAPYETEVLFTEDGENYWLAVRKEFLPKFDRELKKGDVLELFLIKLGNIRIDDKFEPVLLAEKYIKQ